MADFNEMNKRLGEASQTEARVNQLANELFKRGLAMTMDSAKQLATSMVETELRIQKRYQEHTRPTVGQGAPSYNQVARESVAKRVYNRADEPVRQTRSQEPVKVPLVEGFPRGRTLKELNEEYESSQYTVQENARRENVGELRARALRPEPVAVHEQYDLPVDETPTRTDIPPTEEHPPLDSEEFIELRPEHLPSEPKAEPLPAPEALAALVIQPAVEPDEGFLPVGVEEHHDAEPGDEDVAVAGEPPEQPAEQPPAQSAEPTPEPEPSEEPKPAQEPPAEPPAKPKEDLAKKHGVDLHSIFNVNK